MNTLPHSFAAGICRKGESSGARILLKVFFVVIISLNNNVLAADLGGNDVTQGPSNNGKAAHSLLLKNDVAAFGQAPVETPTTAEGEVPPQEKGATGSPFSLDFPKLLLRDTRYVLSSPARWDAKDWLMVGVGIAGVAAASLADQSLRTQAKHLQNGSARDRFAFSAATTHTQRWDSFMWVVRFSTTLPPRQSSSTALLPHLWHPALLLLP